MARPGSYEQPKAQADRASGTRALLLRRSAAGRERRNARGKIPRRPADEVAPVSFGQEQIWLHAQLAPEVPLYTESLTIRRNGPLEPDALVTSFREIVRRHEIWRTTFVWSHGQLIQQVHPDSEPRIRVADLRHLPPHDREPSALQLAAEDLRRPFDLAQDLGVRVRLVTLSDTDHRLFLCLHHMVFDGISIYRVFLSELAALYEATVSGAPCALEELPVQYADFAHWQRRSVEEAALEPLLEYWRKQLAGASTMIDLPADHARPCRQSFRGGLVRFEIPADLAAAVRSTALDENCTLFMLLLATFAVTLHRWSGQTDMLIGSVSGGRDHPDLEPLIGYFMRTLVIRTDVSGNPTFREILGRVREVLLEALCHDALPFQRLVQSVARERLLSQSPLFQVTFSIEPPKPALGLQWDVTELDAGAAVSKFDLSIELEDRGEVIAGRAIYSLDLFEASMISKLLSDYTLLLRRAVSDPGERLQGLVGSLRARRCEEERQPREDIVQPR
jgi:surfactin family lipopeptide synthetase A